MPRMTSQGKIFANWVRDEMGIEPNEFPKYMHDFGDGRKPREVVSYPVSLLPAFHEHFHEVWLKERAVPYFEDKDPDGVGISTSS